MSMTIDQVIQRLAKGDTKGLTEEQISNAVQAMQTAKSGAPTFVVRPGAYGGTVLEFKVDGGRPVSHGAKVWRRILDNIDAIEVEVVKLEAAPSTGA